MQPEGLEAALAVTAEKVAVASRASAAATRELKKAGAGSATGSIRDLRKALDAAVEATEALNGAVLEARRSFDFDETAHLASGAYLEELVMMAGERGVAMFVEDEQLLCYPSLIRVLPADASIQIDRRREKRLRPSVVIDALAVAQNRPPRFKAEPFLESLLSAYELLAAREEKVDPVLRLDEIYSVLTLFPGQAKEYTKPEYARDLYLLDQSAVTTTKRGRTLRWLASSGTRGPGVLTTVAKSGQQQRYWGVSFTPR